MHIVYFETIISVYVNTISTYNIIVGCFELRALVWLTDLLKPLGKFSLVDRIPTKCYYRFVKRFDCVSPVVDVNEGLVMRVYWIAGLAAWRIIENMITRLIIRLL